MNNEQQQTNKPHSQAEHTTSTPHLTKQCEIRQLQSVYSQQ